LFGLFDALPNGLFFAARFAETIDVG